MQEPTIKILFTGLLDFYIPPSGRVEIGALREDSHCLSIGIQKFVDDNPVEPPKILTYYRSPAGGDCAEIIEGERISLEVTGATGNVTNLARELIIFDGPEFHEPEKPITYYENSFTPVITIEAGNACRFYSAMTAKVKQERDGHGKSITITSFVGADIDLTGLGPAVLRYGRDLEREYPMPPSDNTRYVMFVENSCLGDRSDEDDEETDFGAYYEYCDIHPTKQYKLKKEHKRKEPRDKIIERVRDCVWGESWAEVVERKVSKDRRRIDNPCDPIGTSIRYWTEPPTP